MKKVMTSLSAVAAVVVLMLGTAGLSAAQTRNERDVRDALRSLSSRIDDFEYDLRYQMQSRSASSSDLSYMSDQIRELKDQVRQFQANFDRKRENRSDVNAMLEPASRIESYIRRGTLNRRVESNWTAVKGQIERIASNYGVTPEWNEQPLKNVPDDNNYPTSTSGTFSVGLSGTYDLDLDRSERIDDIVANSGVNDDQREDLEDKLEAPGKIAIDIRGDQVTLATSNASPVTFVADGQDRVENSASGRTVRVRATLSGSTLTVSSLGGETDYTITFTSVSNGQVMKVSRRITTDYLNQTVFAESVYNKTDTVARLGIDRGGNYPTGGYSDNDQGNNPNNGGAPNAVPGRTGNFVVPNGTVITGVLENEINTKVSQNNDRFRMTVQSPAEFRGAVVEGYITGVGRSGQVSGRSNVTFNFMSITLRDGRTYDFAGNLVGVKDHNGKDVKVDTEGTAKGDSQTKETAKRGGIGAGLGALIGAIAGGAKGAVIGAVIGGGAGAGSVAIMGRDDIQLMKGSTITVESSSPIRGPGPQDR